MASVALRCVLRLYAFCLSMLLLAGGALAGNFAFSWGTAPYTWTANSLGPNNYTLTDQYGFQVQVRLSVTQSNGASAGAFPDDLTTDGAGNTFGTQRSIWLVWNPSLTGGGIGGSTNVATMQIRDTAGNLVGVNGLTFRASDIDAVDQNTNPPTNDRCDHVTFTGNAGNPTLTAVTGTPTFRIGPGAGAGASPTLAANQVQCNFQTSTAVTSPTSNGDDNGTVTVTYPNGTNTAIVNYDESIHNVYNNTTFNAAARGMGVWSATAFVLNNTISLDKTTTATGYTSAGNTIAYTYVVTNNGPLPILSSQNIQIQDDKIGTFTCPAIPAAGIAVGGTHTCTANYTVTAADVTAGLVTNTAIAGVGTGALAFASRLQSNSDAVTVRRFATLTLAKTVTNDNGGTATTAAFTLSAAGPTNISGVSGNAAVTNVNVQPGVYALSETNITGYAASAWSCSSGSLAGSNLTITSGQNVTCTINNNDVGPVLTLVKTITGDGSPSGVPSFTLAATGPVSISGVTGSVTVTNATVSAGSYVLSETGPSGYAAGAWSCSGGSLAGSNLTLALGQTATCTINNTKLPTLTLRKISNGGTGSFSFAGSNGVPSQSILTTAAGSTFTGSLATLAAASTSTAITETMPATFWQIQSATCTGMGAGGTATLAGNTLTLDTAATAAGSNIICTFTNRRRPTVSVQKITTGAAGGSFSFADTNLTGTVTNITTTAVGTATPAVPARLIATTTGQAVTLAETSPLSFVAAGVTCSDANSAVSGNTNPVAISATGSVTIPLAAVRVGADINCVFTNAQAIPQLAVSKTASLPSLAAAGSTVTYTIAVSNTGNTALSSIAVSDPLGSVVCPSSGAASITSLAAGASESCTLTYAATQAVFDNNGGGDGDLDNTATASATYNANPVSASGSAAVALTISPGLSIQKVADTAGPVNAGAHIGYTYRVTNTGNVTVNNVTINDAHNGFGTDPVPNSEAIFNDVAPLGDSADAAANGSWDSLAPGDSVQFSANYTVVQADIDNLQ